MRIAIIATGAELMTGELCDTNSAWLSAELFHQGMLVTTHCHVGDDLAAIARMVQDAAATHDAVVVSGGLGPTDDDLTVEAMASLLGVGVEIHEPSLARAEEFFRRKGLAFSPGNRKQAMTPAGVEVYLNPEGLAPGFAFTLGASRVYVVPGVPRECLALCRQSVLPALREQWRACHPEVTAFRLQKLLMVPESRLQEAVADLPRLFPGLVLGFRAHSSEVWLKLIVTDADAQRAEALATAAAAESRRRFPVEIYAEADVTLPQVVGGLLKDRGLTMATAESCTGGMVGGALTEVPGSSAWYVGGVVTYSNDLKTSLLGVSKDLLAAHGAVSEACARVMAEGARSRLGADLAVAVTGVAGPDGGSKEKPVGTVHIALATPQGTRHRLFRFRSYGRDLVRSAATTAALDMARRYLLGFLED